MKSFKKVIKFIGILILILIIGSSIYIYTSGPVLPKETDEIIENVIANPLPELVTGKTGFAKSQGINIWYESRMPEEAPKGTILLIMGISNDALGWPTQFVQSFIDSGYQVIRYDHRGTGMSDWNKDFDSDNPYSLSDMAHDGISILDALQIKKANIIGISMGGMIAQELAINHPDRVQSLSSIMSSGNIFDQNLPPISSDVAYELIKVAIKYSVISSEKNMVKLHLASRLILAGDNNNELNIKELSEQVLYNIRKRNGYNPNVSQQHQAAVFKSGSRYDSLKTLKIPTVVIHGASDPFIPIEHGKKCVHLIPNSDSMWIENMGHDIPNDFIPLVTQKIIDNFKNVY